jgi:F-type H+-transporting ATPase subunit b
VKARRLIAMAGVGLALAVGSVAFGQGQPQQLPPGMRPPGMPQGMPGMPPPRMGTPTGLPGMRPPGRPKAPVRRGSAEPAEEEHEGGHAEHCPGHGPMDPPPPLNLWHGLIGVNNEAAQSDSAWKHLLFRYENPTDPCDPLNEPPPFFASLLNFAVLAFLIGKFGQKPVAAALVKRKESIMQEIDNATRLREEAEARLAEYEEKFENIEQRLAEAKAEYAAQAEQEKQRILLEAEERRARMRRDAEFRIEQELKEARLALIREAVLGAVQAAEALLTSRVVASDQDRLAEDYLASVGKAAAAKGANAPGGRA